MEDKSIRVLHMTKLGPGGISTLTVNIQSLINPRIVNFDYLVFENSPTFYEQRATQLGGRKLIVDVKKYNNNKLLLYWKKYKGTKKLIKNEGFQIVHVDASTPMDVVIGLAAKHAGAKTRIIHSHIAGDNKHSFARTCYLQLCRCLMKRTFTDYFAISDSAAKFMFPKSICDNKRYRIIKNGIIAERYYFDKTIRDRIRKELNIESSFVLGHVGRFSVEKRHDFILDIFKELKNRNINAKLLLIGDGGLRKAIEDRINADGLENDVILYGTSMEVPSLLMAMDAFVFPSTYEGLGIAAVEAQCSGLPTFCSEGIPDETKVTSQFVRIPGYVASEWADKILEHDYTMPRKDDVQAIKKAGFDLSSVARALQSYYEDSYYGNKKSDKEHI